MPRRGGARPFSGSLPNPQKDYVLPDYLTDGMSPLEYMLRIIRDPKADTSRRDRMAMAAAPYCHPRMMDQTIGKKERARALSKKVLESSEWDSDLSAILNGVN